MGEGRKAYREKKIDVVTGPRASGQECKGIPRGLCLSLGRGNSEGLGMATELIQ